MLNQRKKVIAAATALYEIHIYKLQLERIQKCKQNDTKVVKKTVGLYWCKEGSVQIYLIKNGGVIKWGVPLQKGGVTYFHSD